MKRGQVTKKIACHCGYIAAESAFGSISINVSDSSGSAIGRLNNNHCGAVSILVCPRCGLLYSSMGGQIRIGAGL